MTEDIRWKQRLSNYKKAFHQLTLFIEKPELNEFEQQGLVQCFEYTFELAWKTMKDWLNWQGVEANSPRTAIQFALQSNLIGDGHMWLEALEKRNLMAHTYDETITRQAVCLIRNEYFLMLQHLHAKMEALTSREEQGIL